MARTGPRGTFVYKHPSDGTYTISSYVIGVQRVWGVYRHVAGVWWWWCSRSGPVWASVVAAISPGLPSRRCVFISWWLHLAQLPPPPVNARHVFLSYFLFLRHLAACHPT